MLGRGNASGWCYSNGMVCAGGCRNDSAHYNVFGSMYIGLCDTGRSMPVAGECNELPVAADAGKRGYGSGARGATGSGCSYGAGEADGSGYGDKEATW